MKQVLLGMILLLGACTGAALSPVHDPLQAVQRIYTLPDPDFGVFENPERRVDYYTPRIVALTAQQEACYKKKFGMDHLDFNYIVPGQDYDISDLRAKLLRKDGDDALVQVNFHNGFSPIEMQFHLKNMKRGWLIDNVIYGESSLQQDLTHPCGQE